MPSCTINIRLISKSNIYKNSDFIYIYMLIKERKICKQIVYISQIKLVNIYVSNVNNKECDFNHHT
jgi:hypothetical protein